MVAAAFMDLLDGTIVQVALPSIHRGLRLSDAGVQWTASAYTLAFALLLVTGARLGDLLGRRRVFLGGLVAFIVASATVAGAQTGAVLIAFRAAQGAAAALMLPQVLTFIQTEFDRDLRPKAFALYGMVLALAGAAGPLLGGLLISANIAGLGWRAIFLVNIPVGIAALLLGRRLIGESRPNPSSRLDPLGTLVLSAGLLAIFYPLIEGRQLGWPTWTFACLGASVPLLGLFAFTQARLAQAGGTPLLDLTLLRFRGTAVGLVVTLAFFGATSFFFVLTLFLQLGLGYSALKTGISFLPFSIGIILGSGGASPLGQRYGRNAVTAGTLIMTATLASMIYVIHHQGTRLLAWQLSPSLLIAGLAFGVVSGTLADIVLGGLPTRLSTSASGVVNTVIQLASVLAIAVAGAIFFSTLGHRPDPHTFITAADSGLLYLTACCAAATLATRRLPCTRSARHPDQSLIPERPAPGDSNTTSEIASQRAR
jgi:EmrB/QacA subfamily drug resistance transporter